VVPYLADLDLPEEDSVAFKAGLGRGARGEGPAGPAGARPAGAGAGGAGRVLDIACLDLPRISNFTDLDALRLEPDVSLRIVRSAAELGTPDAVILPGSKNTLSDLAHLRETGLAKAVLALPPATRMIGICAGLQMLGQVVEDPEGIESDQGRAEGLALLPLATVLGPDKTLRRTTARHEAWGQATGYEIHHGETTPLGAGAVPVLRDTQGQGAGRAVGWATPDGRVFATYLHGVFDADGFRRAFLDDLRRAKGLEPLEGGGAAYSLEPALDRLAGVVRECVDLGRIYRALGL
jgi:cobyric acid synthase